MSALQQPFSQRKFKTFRTVMALILREMATTYGRSPGGYVWALAEPIAGIALLTFAFSLAFKSPPLGNEFAIFYATGVLPFMLYMDISMKVTLSIRFSKHLLAYPSVTFFDSILARFILNLITQVLVFVIVISGLFLAFNVPVILEPLDIVFSLSMAAALGLGVGTLNCFLVSTFSSWDRIWAILNRPMFIVSCIFFLLEVVPEPFRSVLWFNPLVHVTGSMRSGFYPTYSADYVSGLYVFGFSGLCFLFGMIFLGRFHREILNN